MTDTERVTIYRKALGLACKYIRQNVPAAFQGIPHDVIPLLFGGMERDPEGKEFEEYFLVKAILEEEKKGKKR